MSLLQPTLHPSPLKRRSCRVKEVGDRYLRVLRVACSVERRAINRFAVQLELAKKIGLELEAFQSAIEEIVICSQDTCNIGAGATVLEARSSFEKCMYSPKDNCR